MKCPKCYTENPDTQKFCGECGQRLEVVAEAESERKHVTALFSDMSGYTAISENLDPEEVKEITSRIFSQISHIVAKYDGFIEKFIGDAVMALFGVPKAHEDDPVRAIRAAMEIHEYVREISPELEKKTGKPFSMHTGVNTGLVVTGEVNMEKGTHGIAGDTINVAARLSSLARADTVIVGPDTYRQAEGYFNFGKLEPAKVKGKEQRIQIYKVISFKKKHIRVPSLHGFRSGLVGREGELAQLIQSIDTVRKNLRGCFVSVVGEAGIGKSRLLAELRERLWGNKILWLEGGALSYGESIGYWPFMEIIKMYAGVEDEDDDSESWSKLENRISKIFPDQKNEILPYLGTLLALDIKSEMASRVRFLDGEAMGRQIFRSSRLFFERLARERPLILLFEDFHLADHSSVELLGHLLPLLREVPIIICILCRSIVQGPVAGLLEKAVNEYGDCYRGVNLVPLTHKDSVKLVCNLLRMDNISKQMHGILDQKSEGNPLYIEELIRTLMDMKAIVQDRKSGQWEIKQFVGKLKIPDTLRGLIIANIDQLDSDIKDILKVASVIGRSFLYRLLKTVRGAKKELYEHLDELKLRDFIREKSEIPELEYIFKHDLTRDAAYESVLLQQRLILHRKVAEAIETIFIDHL